MADKDHGRDGNPGPPGPVRLGHPQVRHGARPERRAVRRQCVGRGDGVQDVRDRPDDGGEGPEVQGGLQEARQALRLPPLQPDQRRRLRAPHGHRRHRHPLPVQHARGPQLHGDRPLTAHHRRDHVQGDREDAARRHPRPRRGGGAGGPGDGGDGPGAVRRVRGPLRRGEGRGIGRGRR